MAAFSPDALNFCPTPSCVLLGIALNFPPLNFLLYKMRLKTEPASVDCC